MCILGVVLIIMLILVWYILEIGYPKRNWFKYLLHDKCHLHIPDFKKQLDYDIKLKTVYTSCKLCHTSMIYTGICKYLVQNNPNKIPNSVYDSYCRECIAKNYTHGHDCCPRNCNEIGVCNYCERDWNNE